MSDWAALDTAPRDKKILLLCPWTDSPDSPDGTGGHADAKVNNGRVVGWWDATTSAWVAGLPGGEYYPVYPSRWTDIADEPT